MSIDGTAVKALADQFAKPYSAVPVPGEVMLVPSGWKELRETQDEITPFKVGTLSGLANYAKCAVDGLDPAKLIVHVESPVRVWLAGPVESEKDRFRRAARAVANCPGTEFPFGRFVEVESFIIGLHTSFVKTEERDALLATVAGIRQTSEAELRDDGLSQEVMAKKGVGMLQRSLLPNPLFLQPWRTFREIEQPESAFVLRARASTEGAAPTLALFAADGHEWELDAVKKITDWFTANLPEIVVIG